MNLEVIDYNLVLFKAIRHFATVIVKELIHKGFIKAENVGQEIRLTSKGLDKCRENCK